MKYAKIITDKETIEKFLKSGGQWVLYGLDSHIHWPVENTIVEFNNRKLILFPETEKLMPAVALKTSESPKITGEEGFSVLNAFLSSMAWIEDSKINVLGTTSGSTPMRVGKSDIMYVSNNFSLLALPILENDISKLSLALYREALGLSGYVYKFLSFYRIIELNAGGTDKQKRWINRSISKIKTSDIGSSFEYSQKHPNESHTRLDELKGSGINDIGEYLFFQCRSAIAHASNRKKTINPDNLNDVYQIQLDLPFIERLARLIIKEKLNILTQKEILKDHLYETLGFKNILGDEIVDKIKNNTISKGDIKIPNLNIKLRDKVQYKFLENLQTIINNINEGVLVLECFNSQIMVVLHIDFVNNRIHIDPEKGFFFSENATNKTRADFYRFWGDCLKNGEVEIYDIENHLLSIKDPYIPVNIDVRATIDNFKKIIMDFEK